MSSAKTVTDRFRIVLICIAWICLDHTTPANAQESSTADPFGGSPVKRVRAPTRTEDPFAGNDPFGDSNNQPNAQNTADPFAPSKPDKLAKRAKVSSAKRRWAPINRSETETAIRKKLDHSVTANFVQIPLCDAITTLSTQLDLPIVIDSRALEEIGMSSEASVTVQLHDVSFRGFLAIMLHDLDLTYLIANEVMVITTRAAAESNLQVFMIRLPESIARLKTEFTGALVNTIQSDTWAELGGPSTMSLVGDVLVVSTTELVWQEVRDFIRRMEITLHEKE